MGRRASGPSGAAWAMGKPSRPSGNRGCLLPRRAGAVRRSRPRLGWLRGSLRVGDVPGGWLRHPEQLGDLGPGAALLEFLDGGGADGGPVFCLPLPFLAGVFEGGQRDPLTFQRVGDGGRVSGHWLFQAAPVLFQGMSVPSDQARKSSSCAVVIWR